MKVLVACEESQAVTIEFRKRGHEVYSCDIQECSGNHPEWHIMADAVPLLERNCEFETCDGQKHHIDRWDLLIAFPPCTYLTVAGNRWFNVERYGDKAIQRIEGRKKAVEFFLTFANADIEKIAIENPIGIMSTVYRKPDQIVQPYMFGDKARKGTCLWLKNLPLLQPTNVVDCGEILEGGYSVNASAHWAEANGKILRWNDPLTAKIRSKTYLGLAKAMATQWSEVKSEYYECLI